MNPRVQILDLRFSVQSHEPDFVAVPSLRHVATVPLIDR